MAFHSRMTEGVPYLEAELPPGVRHAFSTRRGGVSAPPWDSLNIGLSMGDRAEDVAENHRRLLRCIGLAPHQAVCSRQVHGAQVRRCTQADAGCGLLRQRDFQADALITCLPGLALTVFSADCGTVLLYDPAAGAVGAIHAGWRGCAAGVVHETVRAMQASYGTQPGDLWAALGPCIGRCCFETEGDVPAAMTAALGPEAEPFLLRRGAKWQVDLAGLNGLWLRKCGLLPQRIQTAQVCTACHPEQFWSHRRMGRQRGLQGAVIALEGGA